MKQVHLKILGLVQGVGYRYTVQQEAKKRGLVGYVANLPDGSVELVAFGPAEDLKGFVSWCYNGVGTAVVKTIEITWKSSSGKFKDFVIKF